MAELMIALAIFSLVIGAFVTLIFRSDQSTKSNYETFIASRIAEEGLSATRALANQNWDALTTGAYGINLQANNWTISGGSTAHGNFTRTITTQLVSASDKRVESKVTWTTAWSAERSVSHVTNITNWRARQIENDISGDWRHPVSIGSGDISPNGNAGQNLTLVDHFVYLVSQHPPAGSNDFHIFDIDVKPNPSLLASLNLGNVSLVSVSGQTGVGYAINNDVASQIFVVNTQPHRCIPQRLTVILDQKPKVAP